MGHNGSGEQPRRSSRTYYNLTEVDSGCFSADFDGDTIMFCRWTG